MKKYFITFCILFVSISAFAQTGTYSGGGDGSSESKAIEISTKADLIELSNNPNDWSLFFKQTANISFNEDETLEDWDGNGEADGAIPKPIGFTPIGSEATQFTGYFNGQGYTITNLYIYRPLEAALGLFGYAKNSKIKNCKVIECDISGRMNIGGLVGANYDGLVENCYTSGRISGNDRYIGGLVGGNVYGAIVKNCSSSAEVNGAQDVGGLIGGMYGSKVNYSFCTGHVKGNESVGGLVGFAMDSSRISKCYSTGYTEGIMNVGGLIGATLDCAITNTFSTGNVKGYDKDYAGFIGALGGCKISCCYSTGQVLGAYDKEGGFIGWVEKDNTSYFSCFWRQDPNEYNDNLPDIGYQEDIEKNVDSENISAITNANLKLKSTFIDWDFTNIWDIDSEKNNGYPFLREDLSSVEEEIELLNELIIYPNPTQEFITISNHIAPTCRIYDIHGRLVLEFASNTADISELSIGIYFLIAEDNGKFYYQRFIKN